MRLVAKGKSASRLVLVGTQGKRGGTSRPQTLADATKDWPVRAVRSVADGTSALQRSSHGLDQGVELLGPILIQIL